MTTFHLTNTDKNRDENPQVQAANADSASPVIAAFVRIWQIDLPNEDRDRICKPLLRYAADTKTNNEQVDCQLAWMAANWLIRVHTPAWLTIAELDMHASTLRTLPELNGDNIANHQPTIAAARIAAWDATQTPAEPVIWEAVRATARDAARAVAPVDTQSSAGQAAQASVRAAVRAAGFTALAPTVAELQTSAADLFTRMCRHAKDAA